MFNGDGNENGIKINRSNKNRQKVIFTVLPIFQFFPVPFWKTFVTRKMSTIFKSGLYSTFSNSTIMKKNKEVSH